MNLRQIAMLLPLLLPACAHGQVGVYGEFNGALNNGSFAGYTGMLGATGGAYLDFGHLGPLKPGIDVRDVFLSGTNQPGDIQTRGGTYRINALLFGLRLSRAPSASRFRPYGEILAGPAAMQVAGDFSTHNYVALQGVGGLDVKIAERFDWRAVEAGYQVITGSYTINGGPTLPIHGGILGTGIVFRF